MPAPSCPSYPRRALALLRPHTAEDHTIFTSLTRPPFAMTTSSQPRALLSHEATVPVPNFTQISNNKAAISSLHLLSPITRTATSIMTSI
ncbi:hypothetical protein NL676_015323 [Syzygium grande]|nr:hypothetical protein NL676_015323 [Syzygium grande]